MDYKYFVTYMPYSDIINRIYVLTGETKEYYKVEDVKAKSCAFLVRKRNFMGRGSDIKFYPMSEEEVVRKLQRQKAVNKLRKTDFDKLTDSQLERIIKIVEEK